MVFVDGQGGPGGVGDRTLRARCIVRGWVYDFVSLLSRVVDACPIESFNAAWMGRVA